MCRPLLASLWQGSSCPQAVLPFLLHCGPCSLPSSLSQVSPRNIPTPPSRLTYFHQHQKKPGCPIQGKSLAPG